MIVQKFINFRIKILIENIYYVGKQEKQNSAFNKNVKKIIIFFGS